jgi:hypothetical protein
MGAAKLSPQILQREGVQRGWPQSHWFFKREGAKSAKGATGPSAANLTGLLVLALN